MSITRPCCMHPVPIPSSQHQKCHHRPLLPLQTWRVTQLTHQILHSKNCEETLSYSALHSW